MQPSFLQESREIIIPNARVRVDIDFSVRFIICGFKQIEIKSVIVAIGPLPYFHPLNRI